MTYIPVAEAAKMIRARLKAELGATSKDVSVKSSSYSMGSNIDLVIKTDRLSLKEVERIANLQEKIHRDSTGEILGGGNRFVDVKYDDSVVAPLRAKFRAALETEEHGWIDGWCFDRCSKDQWRAEHIDADAEIRTYEALTLARMMAVDTLSKRLATYPVDLCGNGPEMGAVREDWRLSRQASAA